MQDQPNRHANARRRESGSRVAAASRDRSIHLRRRQDLIILRQQMQGEPTWIVKDPLALRYFQFNEQEHAVLEMLDGRSSLAEIKQHVEERFSPRVTTYDQLHALLHRFTQCQLLVADAFGQGESLDERGREATLRLAAARMINPLFIRLASWDPERLLRFCYPMVKWVYHPLSLLVMGLLALSALLLVTVQFAHVAARLPSLYEFFSAGNVVLLLAGVTLCKITHELAHAFTCKHFGGECHEIGAALLVFAPCLYCDTSDAWTVYNRWHRVAISAAGMLVELALASACLWLWWFSREGTFHYFCLNVVLVCSVSTLLFNGNPLLRFDGYYILADVLEVPNLWQRSRAAFEGYVRQLLLGVPWRDEPVVPHRRRAVFAAYAIASLCYRWFVLVLILWFLAKVLQPYGLQVLGYLLIGFIVCTAVAMSAFRIIRFFRVPGRWRQLMPIRLAVAVVAAAALVATVLAIPFDHHVMTPVLIQPHRAQRIYVNVPGQMMELLVAPGDRVEQGQSLARLVNMELAQEISQLTGRRDRLEVTIRNVRRQLGTDPAAAAQLPTLRAALADIDQRFEKMRAQADDLTIRSPCEGVVLPPPYKARQPLSRADLHQWSGSPWDRRNLGCWLERGTLLCIVGLPQQMEAVLMIDESDLAFVKPDQQVSIRLDEYPTDTLYGRIDSVGTLDVQSAPLVLSHKTGGDLHTSSGRSGEEATLGATYHATVPLMDLQHTLLRGFRGRAKVLVEKRTLGERIWRAVRQAKYFW